MKSLIRIIGPLLLLGVPLMLWWQFGDTVKETSAPVTLGEAQGRCPVPLPKSAKNVQYSIYTDGPAYQCWVRCEAPVDECTASIEEIFRYHADKMKIQYTAPTITPITGSAALPAQPREGMHTAWFDIAQIKNGVTAGDGVSRQPKIWVDKDRGVLYFYMSN